jgi:hypothetical protein
MGFDGRRHTFSKQLAIDGQRRAGRHTHLVGHAHDERPQPTHFFLEQPYSVVEFVAPERVAAHQLGQPIGLMYGGRSDWTHLIKRDVNAERCRLPRGLAAGQPATNDSNVTHLHPTSIRNPQSAIRNPQSAIPVPSPSRRARDTSLDLQMRQLGQNLLHGPPGAFCEIVDGKDLGPDHNSF